MAVRFDFADLDTVDAEYGVDPDACSFCGGVDGCHLVLTRSDRQVARCQVGDVRELVRRLRRLQVQYEQCAQCRCALEPSTDPPHCDDCNVDDEHLEIWDEAVGN
jgi:hypothetical protein